MTITLTVRLPAHDIEASPADVALCLDALLTRKQILDAMALAECGHTSISAACATFGKNIEGMPRALGAVLDAYLDTPAAEAARQDALERVNPARLHAEQARLVMFNANVSGARDTLLAVGGTFDGARIPQHAQARSEKRLSDLKQSKFAESADPVKRFAALTNKTVDSITY